MLQDAKSPRTVQIAPGIGIHHIFIVPGYQLDNQRAPFCSFVLVDRSVSEQIDKNFDYHEKLTASHPSRLDHHFDGTSNNRSKDISRDL
ncbi:hypothetical protein PGTUg99_020338 [Puccinia graminis f. sp. tritici]|uniref:Uncharacterized protein n=1 Tax=Puccinia graminis f. sp. tritici TaxID=56615 RepID=A0A5B0RTQ0_PUCGR|nr:hypothetical protein PGTUg99_020338 [Puccinia graminis f. sp. tritici]